MRCASRSLWLLLRILVQTDDVAVEVLDQRVLAVWLDRGQRLHDLRAGLDRSCDTACDTIRCVEIDHRTGASCRRTLRIDDECSGGPDHRVRDVSEHGALEL